ncbi:isoaspartyl peptidase/L-asparaginase [Brevundimonas sp. 2R-24]|uniref:Isoaspartyl peptidase/L-asparaginase n=1 Tax=Peiella sedimenti TaxID=3061083 RepID=A0ABT8SNR3_9CAUL|nr:isoaspartyl peptidase/L-asparaginase [Caulobacteraceae bacterium XZ-24]
MTRILAALAAFAALVATAPAQAQEGRWALALHGGAGTIERSRMTPQMDAAYRAALTAALERGAAVLRAGGSSLDAIQAVIEGFEDDELFNAGRGAVFTAEGVNSLDASIMDGRTLAAGAVAGAVTTRHPIALARAVMEQSPHVMLSGRDADRFAASVGLEQVPTAYFFTERRWRQLEEALTARGEPIPPRPEGAGSATMADAGLDDHRFGTVGVVALDQSGRIAAGTSTGGTTAKRWGRIGDSPIIGAGTYASNLEGCAVSATGTGEYFIRFTVARDICALRHHQTMPIQQAADAEIAQVGQAGGDGGVIVLSEEGDVAFAMNTSGMYRGLVTSNAPVWVAIYADEE